MTKLLTAALLLLTSTTALAEGLGAKIDALYDHLGRCERYADTYGVNSYYIPEVIRECQAAARLYDQLTSENTQQKVLALAKLNRVSKASVERYAALLQLETTRARRDAIRKYAGL